MIYLKKEIFIMLTPVQKDYALLKTFGSFMIVVAIAVFITYSVSVINSYYCYNINVIANDTPEGKIRVKWQITQKNQLISNEEFVWDIFDEQVKIDLKKSFKEMYNNYELCIWDFTTMGEQI